MTHERLPSYDLLSKAAEIKKKKDQERVSVEEAKEGIPELKAKIMRLLGFEEEEPIERTQFTEEERKRRLEDISQKEIQDKVFRRVEALFTRTIAYFDVPQDEETIQVTLSKGKRSMSDSSYIDRGLEVDISMLDSILRIDGGNAVIESKAHNHKPIDMYAPIGPGSFGKSDLGVVWRRAMSMDDFNDYNQLLDRLTEPDVIRVDNQVSSR